MRWAYVDEAGISANEKCVTVGGILLNADLHHRALRVRLEEIRASLPGDLGHGLIFHAKDIWHGNKAFDRHKWDAHGVHREQRQDLITQICGLPGEFGLPVVFGFVEKADHNWERAVSSGIVPNLTSNRANYAMAFSMCCISIEACMREIVEAGEVAHIVAENTDEMREHAEWAYAMLERPSDTWEYPHGAYLPLERLAETPQFVNKDRSSILQIADAVAFVLNRHLTLEDESGLAHCWDKLAPQIRIPQHVVAFSAGSTS